MKGERQRREEWDVEGAEATALPPLLGVRGSGAGSSGRRWWGRTVLWAVFAIVLIECAFIVRLDILNSPATTTSSTTHASSSKTPALRANASGTCSAAWLETRDRVRYGRDFAREPVVVAGGDDQNWDKCAVPCVFQSHGAGKVDAAFGDRASAPLTVLRSMESETYFPENHLDSAHRSGVGVVMTTSLASDVPVGYFSWAEYRIMDPVKPKTQKALGAAFISNCGAHNERLAIMRTLQQEGVAIDSYGVCDQNKPGGRGLNKVDALREYKFSLAFENSNVEDYVTEKFFQALVAGSVPIVTGPPNIFDFAPSPNSVVYIKDLSEAKAAAKRIKYLAKNGTAYNETLRWKFDGPSDQFLALVDMAAVHSSCRLCIHVATKIRLKEEAAAPKRPCKCTGGDGHTLYHLYVRERGRFNTESIFIKDSELSITKLKQAVGEKFTRLNHVPIWKTERPKVIRGNADLRVYKIYPVGLTQREALYTWDFGGDKGLKSLVKKKPCLQLEVIFV